jgi:ribose transport system ATP-binding protein
MVEGLNPLPRLEMRGIFKRFGTTSVLQDVGLRVAAGEVHALLGQNGAGKSTLMKILSGSVEPDAGEIFIDGAPFRPSNPLTARREGVAMIYQELSLAPHLTVEENISLGVEPARGGFLRKAAIRRRAADALNLLGHAEILPTARAGSLTQSERQIVEIARAVAAGCRVLVLDEPTSSLSRRDVDALFDLIGRIKTRLPAIVYISHFLEETRRIADRFTVLRDGRVVESGEMRRTSSEEIVDRMVGQRVDRLYPASARVPGEPILEAADLRAGKLRLANLTLRRGEIFGIAGLVGSGRTELLRAIFGLNPIRSGRIRLGLYAGPLSPAKSWWRGAGFLSEDRKTEGLALELPISENLTLTRLPWWFLPSGRDRIASWWIQRLGIRCRGPRQRVSELSGGNQQKVALARLLYHDVDLLLLDEPTRGIDVGARADIYRLLVEGAARSKAVLVVSGYFPELLGLCDRIAVMNRGTLGPARPASEWDEKQLMLEAAA